jgi:deoxyribose-phosphate aldolase
MDVKKILGHCDHTLLKQTATWDDIRQIIDDGIKYQTASVCIPPCYVALAKARTEGRVKVCTVIGFPNGNQSTAVKVFETEDAVRNGADEIDMVINIGWLKDRRYSEILAEIKTIRAACKEKILKVIIETCLLTEEEKIRMCGIVSASGADFIKTSTGFSKGGATREDIALFAKHRGPTLKIKAAGGIATLEDAQDMIKLGAERLGTSRIVKLIKEQTENETKELDSERNY